MLTDSLNTNFTHPLTLLACVLVEFLFYTKSGVAVLGKNGKRSTKNRFSGNHQKCWLWGRHVVSDTLRSGRWPIIDFFVSEEASAELGSLLTLATDRGIAYEVVSAERLEELAHTSEHQGLIARMGLFPYHSASDLSELLAENMQRRDVAATSLRCDGTIECIDSYRALVVLCDRLQDAFNFGAILRCCDAARVTAVIIGEYQQVGVTSQVARSSAGAVNHVPIHRTNDLLASVNSLRELGLQIVAASEKAALPLWQAELGKPSALLIGSEAHGLSAELLNACDLHINIPMLGTGNSLNAAVAAGIVMYEMRRQQQAHSAVK